jgi:hypothetical protein
MDQVTVLILGIVFYSAGVAMGWFACKYVNRMNEQKEHNDER